MQNYVFQLDANKRPLDMSHPARARKRQAQGKAATFRTYPYALIYHQALDSPKTKETIRLVGTRLKKQVPVKQESPITHLRSVMARLSSLSTPQPHK